jgi:hypothetical protein
VVEVVEKLLHQLQAAQVVAQVAEYLYQELQEQQIKVMQVVIILLAHQPQVVVVAVALQQLVVAGEVQLAVMAVMELHLLFQVHL